METSRKYPRSTQEAWPEDYCDPIERPMDAQDRIVAWACAAAICAMVMIAFTVGFPGS
jgi:hypothetical protein